MNPPYVIRPICRLLQENHRRRDMQRHSPVAPLPGERGKRFSRLFFAAVIIPAIALFLTYAALADETLLRGPKKAIRTGIEAKEPAIGKQGVLEEIASAPVHFYQHYLSHQWGRSCAYYPSCSNYTLLAIRKHGILVGSMMTFDRLQHEADEARTSPPILIGGQIKLYDPLDNNDYWWYTTSHSKPASPVNVK